MNPSRIFIMRPIATGLVMFAILLSGLLAYRLLPQAALPQVDYPIIQVATLYPGAGPEVMAMTVTAPLERQLGSISGLSNMSSTSTAGASVITLQFSLDISLDVAEQSVQAAINAASGFLPDELPTPPIYNKVNPADAPVITLAIGSDTIALPRLRDIVETRLSQKLSQISGVGLVSINGGQRPAVRIKANTAALAAYGISFDQIRTAIANGNSNQPKGTIDGPVMAYEIESNSQLQSAQDYQKLIISNVNNTPVRLGDLAEIENAEEDIYLSAWADNQQAILLNIQRQPGANVIEVVDKIRELLPELQASMPSDIEIKVLTDRTGTIRSSIADVKFELMLAIALVVMVIFLFLRSVSATLIPSLAVPLSIVGTFGVMYLAGFSINNLTLMALTIATGFVVDDAIVMIENIARYVEAGESLMQAALKGSKQIGFTIISLTFSLIAVLIPLLFMGDIVGRLFREFAITLAVAILISGFVSLTLTPMLCARLLKIPEHGKKTADAHEYLSKVITYYSRGLSWVLKHQTFTLMTALLTLILTVALAIWIPKGFFPVQDTGVIQAITETNPSASFSSIAEKQQALVAEILKDPAVASVSSIVGVDGVNTSLSNGRLLINLKPWQQRKISAADVIKRLHTALDKLPEIKAHMQPVQDLTLENKINHTQFQYLITSTDEEILQQVLPDIVSAFKQLPQLADTASNEQLIGLRASIVVDKDNAGRLGLTMADIDSALYSAFGQRIVSTIFTQSNQYRVVLEAIPQQDKGLGVLNDIYITSASGAQIPLNTVAQIKESNGPLILNRENQLPSAAISFNLNEGYALGHAVEAIEKSIDELALPINITSRFQGAANAFRAALSNELFLIMAALITMYIVLGVLYESFIHPLTILSTLPSAGVGALLALMLTNTDLNVIAIIGIILLIGIVQKNAIMMIDFALEAERTQGQSPQEAIYNACLLRLRPILMTTLAALFSAIPLVMGDGPGSELRHPLGIAMIGGLMLSQLLTLFTTPVIYLAFGRIADHVNQLSIKFNKGMAS